MARIDNLQDFISALKDAFPHMHPVTAYSPVPQNEIPKDQVIVDFSQPITGEMYCPSCGDIRRFKVSGNNYKGQGRPIGNAKDFNIVSYLPLYFQAECLQCSSKSVLVIYSGPAGTELVVLHDHYGGCVTTHTPEAVKYYIDQAYRAKIMGALSASTAMYRSALEWTLYEQGYTTGLLGKKIGDLVEDIAKGAAPSWALNLDPDFLEAIKEIGNGAMHTNGGNILKQKQIDSDLLQIVDLVFSELLDSIYERPIAQKERLEKLKDKAAIFKQKK